MVTTFDAPRSARARSSAPMNSGGQSMEPTPTITPWPGMSRGTDCTVPMVPGFVSVSVAPWKSATVSLFWRTLRTMSS